MSFVSFADRRAGQQDQAIDQFVPLATAWLNDFGSDEALGALLDAGTDVWLSTFEAAAPQAYIDAAVGEFREMVGESLRQTSEPESPAAESQIRRVATWLATVATNDATWQGFQASGGLRMRWVARKDERVRLTHRAAGGQIRSVFATFDVGGAELRYPGDPRGPLSEVMECRCVLAPAGRVRKRQGMTAAADGAETFEERETALVVLLPAADDSVNTASSEDIAHMTFVSFGDSEIDEMHRDSLITQISDYAADTTPITVPIVERGELGDDSADVLFLEGTDSLMALRDGLMEQPDVRGFHDAVEQYPSWTPHVTLGYPELPALAEYDGDEITFDRFALWIGNDRMEFPMGQQITASAVLDLDVDDAEAEIPDDVDIVEEDLVDDVLVEIPVHGVATIEGKATGDGRMFALGSLTNRPLPLPIRYEFVGNHGGDTSMVAPVGRIDEIWKVDVDGYVEVRYRGVIITTKAYANEAVEGIADGSLTGVSVETDDITVDVSAERERFRQALIEERDNTIAANAASDAADVEQRIVLSDEEIDQQVEQWVGTGKSGVTTFSEARVCGFTIVPIPAFFEGYIALGGAFPDEVSDEELAALTACGCMDADLDAELQALVAAAFAPGTKDGPGWVTNPRATARIRRYWTKGKGAAKIKWGAPGDFNRCRSQLAKYVANPEWLAGLCANMHFEVLGFWPAQHHSGGVAASAGAEARRSSSTVDPMLRLVEFDGELEDAPRALVAGAGWPDAFDAALFANPNLTVETPLTIVGDRVFGHIATWNACHVGMSGLCQNPPASRDAYRTFMKGLIDTTEGELRVGTLTFGIGHIGIRANASQATAHYDKPDAVRAYVVIGEDAVGIWYSGVLRPGLSKGEIKEFRALGAISGDWRYVKNELTLIGVTAVNTPGFQLERQTALVAAAGGHQTALIPPPVVRREPLVASGGIVPDGMVAISATELVGMARVAAREVLEEQALAPRIAALKVVREQERISRIDRVRSYRKV